MELGAVDLPTRHGLAKTLLQASKGTVVTLPDGKKMDARFVKNGKSGGKMNHRVSNNGLMGVAGGDDSNKGTMINGGFDIDELNEAIKRSKEDELELLIESMSKYLMRKEIVGYAREIYKNILKL